jgi:hypothetical protein
MEEWSATNVPPEAIASGPGQILEIDDEWLTKAKISEQAEAMKAWFLARYCDPAEETPYNSREGGYLFVHGGPYDPREEISERFSVFASAEAIGAVTEELISQVGDSWAPIHWGYEDEYDEAFDVELIAADQPMQKLGERISEINGLLGLTGSEQAQKLAERMAFSAAIAALESFLYETMLYWVEADEATVRNIVTSLPEFKETKINLSDIFSKFDSLKTDIKGHLQNIVWHNWKKVVPLLRVGLKIQTPSFAQFDSALLKRHDIVHRSGHTKEGEEVIVTKDEITQLCTQITEFAAAINEAINARDGKAVQP